LISDGERGARTVAEHLDHRADTVAGGDGGVERAVLQRRPHGSSAGQAHDHRRDGGAGNAPDAVGGEGEGDSRCAASPGAGVCEVPPGSNRTMFGRWFGTDGVPWCAIFASYCFDIGAGVVLCRGWPGAGVGPRGVAYVPTLAAWLPATGRAVDEPRPGDLAV